MAVYTARSYACYPLFSVVLFSLGLIVAIITGPGRRILVVAARALPGGIFMIYGKIMISYRYASPTTGAVATRALPSPMITRCGMTALAIS